jgi:hypothetical protein
MRLRWRTDRNGDYYCVLHTLRRGVYGPNGLEHRRSFEADWDRAVKNFRATGRTDMAPGYYCRKCFLYLGPSITELFQVFAGLMTTEEATALLDRSADEGDD